MGARQTVIAAALILAGALVSPASAMAQDEPSNLSWLLSRETTAATADWYADGMPAVVGATSLAAPFAGKCPPPVGPVGCGLAAGMPLSVWSYESASFAKAKRNNSCAIVWDSRDNPVPTNAAGGLTYSASQYNGRECTATDDRPITFDEYTAMRTE